MPFDTPSITPTGTPAGANYREYFAELCRELPPVPDEDLEARAARQNSAMDAVVALHPENAFETRLAVRIVATDAHAADALRAAALAAGDPEKVRQCRASMARHSDAALRALLRIQTTREKQEAAMHPAAMARAGYWFKEVSVPGPDPIRGPHHATEIGAGTRHRRRGQALRRPLPRPCGAHPRSGGRPASTSARRSRRSSPPSCAAPSRAASLSLAYQDNETVLGSALARVCRLGDRGEHTGEHTYARRRHCFPASLDRTVPRVSSCQPATT